MTVSPVFYRGTAHRIWAEVARELLDPGQFLAANIDAVTAPATLHQLGQPHWRQIFEPSYLYQGVDLAEGQNTEKLLSKYLKALITSGKSPV